MEGYIAVCRDGCGEDGRDREAVAWVWVVDNGVLCCDNRHGTERKERKVHMASKQCKETSLRMRLLAQATS